MRKPWVQQHMETAEHAANMSTCASGRKVGAAFIKDNRILSTGFNGVPSGYPHPIVCERKLQKIPSGQGLDKCACAHAEANGIANAARAGVSLYGSTVYTTTQPCVSCMGALANVGVEEVIYKEPYPQALSEQIALHAEIPVLKYIVVNKIGMIDLEQYS